MKPVRALNLILIGLAPLCCAHIAHAQTVSSQAVAVSPQALNFTYTIGGANPAAQNLYLSADVPTQFSVTISGAPWLTVTPVSGLTPMTLTTYVTPPQGVAAGSYSGSVIIGPPASADSLKIVIPVVLQVLGPPQGTMSVNPNSLTFNYSLGGPLPSAQTLTVSSTGATPAGFNVTTNAGWLFVNSSSYVTPGYVQVSVVPLSNMTAGVYTSTVGINPSYQGGTVLQVPVTLRINAPGNLQANPSYMTFSYEQNSPPPAPQILNVVSSNSANVSFTAFSTTSNGGGWLTVQPGASTTPTNVSVYVTPGGLAPGTYNGTIQITPTGSGVGSTQIPVTMTIYGVSQLVVDPASFTFNYQAGNPQPPTQYVSVHSTGSPVNYGISVQGLTWVRTTATLGITPGGFGIVAAPSSTTPPGTYLATVTLSPSNGGGSPVQIPVSVIVAGTNYLTLGRSSVSFESTSGGVNPAPQIVPVTSSSGSIQFEAVAATLGQQNWLNVSQSSKYTPANISIAVSPQGLAAGTYTGTVVVNAEDAVNGQQSIAVTLVVTKTTSLTSSPFGLVFSYQIGAELPKPQTFVVASQGGTTNFTLGTSTSNGSNWLLAVGSGPTPTTAAASVNPANLAPGTYTGQILIASGDSTIPALQMPVVLSVAPGPVFQPAAQSVAFQYQTSQGAPAPQTVLIDTNSSTPTVFYPSVLTADGGKWLSATPDIGTTPVSVTLTVNPKDLKAGLYYGIVAINDPAGDVPVSFLPVTLQVSDTAVVGVPAQNLIFNAKTGSGAQPAQQVVVNTVTASIQPVHLAPSAKWLTVSPVDTFSGTTINVFTDATGLTAGYYLGVITIEIPGVPGSQQYVPVALIVSSGS